jgi:hypothetical protein
VRMRARAHSPYSGNCLMHDWIMALIFSLGCLEMGFYLHVKIFICSRWNLVNAQIF